MRKFSLLFVVFLFLISSLALSQPKIELAGGTNVAFGDVISGSKISKEVTIKNIGKDTLHIKDVRAQCGCTATLLKEKTIAPSQEANLSITFNATGYGAGKVTKHVYVESDDPQTPTLTVEFAPNVVQLVVMNPTMFSFNNSKVDSVITKAIVIKNTSQDTINILSLENSFEYLQVSIGKKNLAPGDTTTLSAVLNTPKAGSFQSTVNLLTDHPDLPKIEIKAFMWVNRK